MKKTDPIADNMAKSIKQLLGTSIFNPSFNNRTSKEYNKARTAISDALNDYEIALDSPVPDENEFLEKLLNLPDDTSMAYVKGLVYGELNKRDKAIK